MGNNSVINQLGLFVLAGIALVAVTADPAFAQGAAGLGASAGASAASAASSGGGSNTLGAVISNTLKSSDKIPLFLRGICYLMGIFFGFMGVLKLKDHVESPNQTTVWEPIKRFVAGGGFFALPAVMGAAQRTLIGDASAGKIYSKFNVAGKSDLGLDGMLARLMENIWQPMHGLMIGFCYLAGIILIIIGISRLLKSEQDGPRGPASIGTIMTFLVGGALLSVNQLLGSSISSLFNTSVATSNGVLNYTAGMDKTALAHAHTVIAAIIGFVAIIGWISFIRGLFILRGVSEGNSQASMMAAITHILGGAIAVNLGGFIMAVQNTLGITKYGIGFS